MVFHFSFALALGPQLVEMMEQLRKDLESNPNANTVTGSYTPRKGELCAAKFSLDNQWYDIFCVCVHMCNSSFCVCVTLYCKSKFLFICKIYSNISMKLCGFRKVRGL